MGLSWAAAIADGVPGAVCLQTTAARRPAGRGQAQGEGGVEATRAPLKPTPHGSIRPARGARRSTRCRPGLRGLERLTRAAQCGAIAACDSWHAGCKAVLRAFVALGARGATCAVHAPPGERPGCCGVDGALEGVILGCTAPFSPSYRSPGAVEVSTYEAPHFRVEISSETLPRAAAGRVKLPNSSQQCRKSQPECASQRLAAKDKAPSTRAQQRVPAHPST